MTRHRRPLAQQRVLITAGPTWEPIDPVRFLANRSSGRLGYALAEAARKAGARVTLVSGPVALAAPRGVRFVPVTTAREMYRTTLAAAKDADLLICAAAVADWRPARVARRKMKKTSLVAGRWSLATMRTIRLIPNPDILAALGRRKRRDQYLVGFALESERLLENAGKKFRDKRCDCIVANPVSALDSPRHAATVLTRDGHTTRFRAMPKPRLARTLIALFATQLSGTITS